MPIDDTKFDENDTFTVARMNARFDAFADTSPATGINALEETDIAREALRADHLPSLIPAATISSPSDVDLIVASAPSSAHTYDHVYGVDAWEVVTDGASPAQITWTEFDLGMAEASRIGAFLVLANIEVEKISCEDYATLSGSSATWNEIYAAFAVQVATGNGGSRTWSTVEHTERFLGPARDYSQDVDGGTMGTQLGFRNLWKDVAIRALITPDEEDAISGIRLVTAFRWNEAGSPTNPEIKLRRYNLSILPLHAPEP